MNPGLHSEVGRLRRVLVCRPGLAQRRLTPANCHELLFDDVLWVSQARNDHDRFVNVMQSRDIEVLELHELLATTVAEPVGRAWLLDRKLGPGTVDAELALQLRPWLEALPPLKLAEHLIGGLARAELPFEPEGLLARVAAPHDFVLAPIMPVTAFAHDHGRFGARRLDVDGHALPYFDVLFWAGLAGVAWLPATMIPAGVADDGLPVGVQVIGPAYGDLRTIALAERLEAMGFAFTPPPALG